MAFLLRTFVAFCLIVIAAVVVVGFLVLEKEPRVRSSSRPAAADFDRVREILEDHDPRQLETGAVRTVTLSERELTLVTSHLLNYYFGGGAAEVRLGDGTLVLGASLPLPGHRWGRFVNVSVTWVQTRGALRTGPLRVGGLPVPGWLAERILQTAFRVAGDSEASGLIQRIVIDGDSLRVTYRWQPELLETVRRRVIPRAEVSRLGRFHAELVRLADEHTGKRASMRSFLKRLFQFARTHPDEQPVADNRAILTILGAYVNGRGLEELVPEARAWGVPKRLTLTLAGRKDLARHFLTSAALAVTGGGFFSDTMGVYKEMADAQRGSGFSFSDLAADRAGIRFSELATESPDSARKVWHLFAGPIRESDIMPSTKDLPEFMGESAFRARFGRVGSPAYDRVARDIEERISSLSLYQRG